MSGDVGAPAEEGAAQLRRCVAWQAIGDGVPTERDILALTDFGLKSMSFEYVFLLLPSAVGPKRNFTQWSSFPASNATSLGRDREVLLYDGSSMGCGKQEGGLSLEEVLKLPASSATFNSLSCLLIAPGRELAAGTGRCRGPEDARGRVEVLGVLMPLFLEVRGVGAPLPSPLSQAGHPPRARRLSAAGPSSAPCHDPHATPRQGV